MAPRILCVHQGAELYGSDRTFLQSVQAFRRGWPAARIRVVLAADGPLRPMLDAVADEVVVRDLCVLRLATPLETGLKGTVAFPYYLAAAWRDVAWADLAYINTTVIADYILAARAAPAKSIVHVHEIPKRKAMPVIRALCRASRASLLFNSRATMAAFALPTDQRQALLYNGVEAVRDAAPATYPDAFSPERPLRLVLLGRINDWKGQDLLIDAVARLDPADRARVRVRIAGSTYLDVREPIEALEAQIAAAGLGGVVTLEPFRDDPAEIYRWADLCVVPSKLPEPFGMVAIEAMAHGRPVVAAGHGGLVEIVAHETSGWHVAPGDADALAAALRRALTDPARLRSLATGALARFGELFAASTMSERLRTLAADWVPALGRPA